MDNAVRQDNQGKVRRVWGVLGEFETPAALLHGAEKVRDAKPKRWDCYAPFAVHGLNVAMGLKASKVSWIVGSCAFVGASGAMLMQWYLSAVNYRIVVHGKPFWAWEQFLPITFELGVLIAGFGAVLGMLALNGLPRLHHPLFDKERFLRASDDAFFIAIEASDFPPDQAQDLLRSAGASTIEIVEEDA